MKCNREWEDYKVIATGDGEKLERWGNYFLLRPDPQVVWHSSFNLSTHEKLNAVYQRSDSGGGQWKMQKQLPEEWIVKWRHLKFYIKPMGFKHTGLFPEQAVNWDIMSGLIKKANRSINVLNLFAYTGGATVACLDAGASVCHVDSAKNMVERAGENIQLNNLNNGNVRFIVDDCRKFVMREIKRGRKYDAIIMDPPSYGRGAGGEVWKLETDLFDFVKLCVEVLSDKPLFVLINSYTTGLQPTVIENVLKLCLKDKKPTVEGYEVCLPTDEEILLPCGASAIATF